jgi:hypothetical protein
MYRKTLIFSKWVTVFTAIIAVSCFFTGCSSMLPQDFAESSPRFVVEEYFSGPTKGRGIFFDRFGSSRASFEVLLDGTWNGSVLTLREDFVYESGERSERVFEIKKIDEHHYEVRTEDIVGVGTIESYGNALRWRYKLRQKIGESVWTLSFDDWMFLRSDGVVLNRAWASKWGIGVGEVFMSVTKSLPPSQGAP